MPDLLISRDNKYFTSLSHNIYDLSIGYICYGTGSLITRAV